MIGLLEVLLLQRVVESHDVARQDDPGGLGVGAFRCSTRARRGSSRCGLALVEARLLLLVEEALESGARQEGAAAGGAQMLRVVVAVVGEVHLDLELLVTQCRLDVLDLALLLVECRLGSGSTTCYRTSLMLMLLLLLLLCVVFVVLLGVVELSSAILVVVIIAILVILFGIIIQSTR